MPSSTDESLLNPHFEALKGAVAGSYLKSYPKAFGPDVHLAAFIAGGGSVESAHHIVNRPRSILGLVWKR